MDVEVVVEVADGSVVVVEAGDDGIAAALRANRRVSKQTRESVLPRPGEEQHTGCGAGGARSLPRLRRRSHDYERKAVADSRVSLCLGWVEARMPTDYARRRFATRCDVNGTEGRPQGQQETEDAQTRRCRGSTARGSVLLEEERHLVCRGRGRTGVEGRRGPVMEVGRWRWSER